VPRRKVLVAVGALKLEFVVELDVLVAQAIGSKTSLAVVALEDLTFGRKK
jgi:hypothetical protein